MVVDTYYCSSCGTTHKNPENTTTCKYCQANGLYLISSVKVDPDKEKLPKKAWRLLD